MSKPSLETQVTNIANELERFKENFKRELEEAYRRGWNDGVAVTPNHKEFHKAHLEPQFYGDDGEIVVLSGKYHPQEAVEKIYALLSKDIEVTLEEVDENTSSELISLAPSDDTEASYYADRDSTGIFDAWVWRA